MTFLSWWHISFGDISVLVIFQFYWHISFSEISVFSHLSFNDISVLVTFQLLWNFSFRGISVLVKFRNKMFGFEHDQPSPPPLLEKFQTEADFFFGWPYPGIFFLIILYKHFFFVIFKKDFSPKTPLKKCNK